MKYINKISKLCAALIFFYSCSEKEVIFDNEKNVLTDVEYVSEDVVIQSDDFKVSESEAIDNAVNFLEILYSDNVSKKSKKISIQNIVPIRKKSSLKKDCTSGIEKNTLIGFDTLFYAVNLSDEQGYV